nr:hypothetical protein [Paenibacillus pasadenensis]
MSAPTTRIRPPARRAAFSASPASDFGATNRPAPASTAAWALRATPPTAPMRPAASIVPVPAMRRPPSSSASGVSRSYSDSAAISPADGPPAAAAPSHSGSRPPSASRRPDGWEPAFSASRSDVPASPSASTTSRFASSAAALAAKSSACRIASSIRIR